MKIKLVILQLLGLLFASASGSLLPICAAEPASASGTNLFVAGTVRFYSHAQTPGESNLVSILTPALRCQQMNLEVIANNLANVNTVGFKKTKLLFQDQQRPAQTQAGLPAAEPGVTAVAAKRIFTQGLLSPTGNNLDLAIQGDGFFQVQLPDGSLAYTRDGSFMCNAQGCIITSTGCQVQGGFAPVPAGTKTISITASGNVTYLTESGETTFQIQLARFAQPSVLDAIGGNLYKANLTSGSSELGYPGAKGFGNVQQGALELSNVNVEEEKASLLLAKCAYETTTKAVQVADEIMQRNHNLQR